MRLSGNLNLAWIGFSKYINEMRRRHDVKRKKRDETKTYTWIGFSKYIYSVTIHHPGCIISYSSPEVILRLLSK